MGQSVEKAFVPDSFEGLAHVKQNSGWMDLVQQVLVDGVGQVRNQTDKLGGGRVLPPKPELLAADEISQHQRDTGE